MSEDGGQSDGGAPEGRCLVIDAHPLLRLGVRRLLEPAWEVEELADSRGAGELLTSVGRFDVAIVEMRSSSSDGVPSGGAAIRSLLAAQPSLGVIAHGRATDRHSVREAIAAGATAYVSKSSVPSALLDAVAAASELSSFVDPATDGIAQNGITRRQREVLQLFADGLSTEAAATRLGLSEETVRTHAKASLARLGARDRTHAVAIAIRGSMIS